MKRIGIRKTVMVERTTAKITSVEVGPVARVFAILYLMIGFGYFFFISLKHTDSITFPLGILAPLVSLNINLSFPRSTGVLGATFQILCCLFTYALTGWITGAAFAAALNFIASRSGGISARFISVEKLPQERLPQQ